MCQTSPVCGSPTMLSSLMPRKGVDELVLHGHRGGPSLKTVWTCPTCPRDGAGYSGLDQNAAGHLRPPYLFLNTGPNSPAVLRYNPIDIQKLYGGVLSGQTLITGVLSGQTLMRLIAQLPPVIKNNSPSSK